MHVAVTEGILSAASTFAIGDTSGVSSTKESRCKQERGSFWYMKEAASLWKRHVLQPSLNAVLMASFPKHLMA
jgi:hypothetical protein